jgi:hypothetical protein
LTDPLDIDFVDHARCKDVTLCCSTGPYSIFPNNLIALVRNLSATGAIWMPVVRIFSGESDTAWLRSG